MTQTDAPHDFHMGWLLFALAMGAFAIGTTEFASMTLLPFIAGEFHSTQPLAGHAISAYALGVVVGSPVIMVLGVRLERRALLVMLAAFIGVANALSAIAPSLPWLVFFRFLSGFPHGAYFGVAMLLAASLVPKNQRAQAVSRVFLGLTIATIVGVPFATWIGQTVGWRWGLGIVAGLAAITALLIRSLAPLSPAQADASPLRELGALRSRQVWLTLGIAGIGFGGVFCVYTYLAATLIEVTRTSGIMIPLVMAVFGLGTTVGNLVCGWAADRATMRAAGISLGFTAVVLMLYPAATENLWLLIPLVFFIGCGVGLAAILQTRLMDVAPHAQSLAGALVQSAFNLANAIGPWVGGIVISLGLGLPATGYAAAALTFGGLGMWYWALVDARRQQAPFAEQRA
ncbi:MULTISPECIES: MFS transporter [unclassified Pseudomonas]|uniref:MFS transporter n=1 Tax=unclassified Pseudomonas TaxID=196821 RepID=UPI000D387211|nr:MULTISPECIES: MFS transporter [unclassified Pseudomonas]RAU44543.1 MFS transporter [Pseudomonas sp. RIT 409]RAU55020.1 MFS transporter [Pseudomonas sp. RIT 412]